MIAVTQQNASAKWACVFAIQQNKKCSPLLIALQNKMKVH
jgi:hypothetical protein